MLAAVSLGGTTAFAATPRQIYDDYADNGRLDRTYSRADLLAALSDAALQGYGGVGGSGLGGTVTKTLNRPNGVLAPQHTTRPSSAAPLGSAATQSVLPFTGLDLAFIALGGAALLAFGGMLRRAAGSGH